MSKSEGLYPSIPNPEQHPEFGDTPPGYAPTPGVATVVVSTPMPIPAIAYGPAPQTITCPHCHQHTTSRIQSESTMKTHAVALILCLLCCIPCCLIPYCVDTCKTRNHYCSSCNAYLGSYQ